LGKLSISIQNRTYRLTCGDGEEQRLAELAEHVRGKAEQLTAEYGRIADDHLMLMSAILIADELWDEREKAALPAKPPADPPAPASPSKPMASPKRKSDTDGETAA